MNPLSVLRDAWYFTRRNLLTITYLCLPFLFAESLAQRLLTEFLGERMQPVYGVLIGLLFYPLYDGALVLFLAARTHGQRPSLKKLWSGAILLWPRLGLLAAICTLAIMLGASLLLFPALLFMAWLAFAEYLLVLEDYTPLQAVKESYRLSKGYLLNILSLILIVMVPLWLLDILLTGSNTEGHLDAVGDVLVGTFTGYCQLFATIVLFRLYTLRRERERFAEDP